jgi:hypothetical protein
MRGREREKKKESSCLFSFLLLQYEGTHRIRKIMGF